MEKSNEKRHGETDEGSEISKKKLRKKWWKRKKRRKKKKGLLGEQTRGWDS